MRQAAHTISAAHHRSGQRCSRPARWPLCTGSLTRPLRICGFALRDHAPHLQGFLFNELRSKTKTLDKDYGLDPSAYPDWSYDGSSTGQAKGNNSDCIIRPVRVVRDPIRGGPHVLVMCEVFSPDGTPHPTNTRSKLREIYANEKVWQRAHHCTS